MKTPRTLAGFAPLSQAEQQIVDEVDSGEIIVLGDGNLPAEDAGADRQVRGNFLRYLALGGCDACQTHEKGLRVAGAVVEGVLDLESCDLGRDLGLIYCRFLEAPGFQSTSLNNLFLLGSYFHAGLKADSLEAKGSIFLREIRSEGEVCLLGAKLGGDLSCINATFHGVRDEAGNVTGYALSADRLEAEGGVFLNGSNFEGLARFLGAKLGGNLECVDTTFCGVRDGEGTVSGGAFIADGLAVRGNVFLRGIRAKGEVRLAGAKLGGNLECDGATFSGGVVEFTLANATVGGVFFWRNGISCKGGLDFRAAEVGVLSDAADCWPDKGHLFLDRFRYGAIIDAPVDAKSRIEWLGLQAGEFTPQPYEQLAKVLRELGHLADARAVLVEKEKEQRKARRKGKRWLLRLWFAFWDTLIAITVRYGRQPLLAFVWLFGFWLLGAGIFGNAAAEGAFKPASPRVLLPDEWRGCAGEAPSQMACFLDRVPGYPRFNALIYSADTLLPIVDLEMQNSWIPDESRGFTGYSARWYLWWQIFVGWALSLLAVAGFSGLVKSD